MDIKLSIYNFLRLFDSKVRGFDVFTIGFGIVLVHSILIYAYMLYTNKFSRYFSKFKKTSDFLPIAIDNIALAIVEQAAFTVFLKLAFERLIGDRKIARFLTCALFSFSHVLNFNVFYEIPTITIQMFNSLIMSLIYTKLDVLDAFILHMFCNLFGVVITYTTWKIISSNRIFQGKTYFTPVSVETTLMNNNIAKTD